MNALLDYENEATVIVVDWKGGSSPPYYQAVANIRLIGAITAHVIYSVFVSFRLSIFLLNLTVLITGGSGIKES